MEWKKNAGMEYAKIVFHSIPCASYGYAQAHKGRFWPTACAGLSNITFCKPQISLIFY